MQSARTCALRCGDNSGDMLELIQATNDPALARRCDALDGFRLWVDLERLGKAQRQAGRSTFISTHVLDDVGRIRAAANRSRLMVRINPLNDGSSEEVDAVLAHGPDVLMLPMFAGRSDLEQFCAMVHGRVPVVALLETASALHSVGEWCGTQGLQEVYVGLNDLHLSLGLAFMFEPLANGDVEQVAHAARSAQRRFGFGGIARLEEGLLPGRDVLAEHLRLGSGAVILSRTFHNAGVDSDFEAEVGRLREAEEALAQRAPTQVAADAERIAQRIRSIAGQMAR
jgi:hypothetical protein